MNDSRHNEAKALISLNWRQACYYNFRTQKACLEEDQAIIDRFVSDSPKDTPKYLAHALWYFSEGIQRFLMDGREVVALTFCLADGNFYVGNDCQHHSPNETPLPYLHRMEASNYLNNMRGLFWLRSIAVDPNMPKPFCISPELASAIVRSRQ